MKNNKVKSYIYLIIAIIINIFIFYQSSLTSNVSGSLSHGITSIIYNVLNKININIEFNNLSYFVRKLAHFTEFFFLALFWYLYYKTTKYKKRAVLFTFTHGLIIAILDETLQTFIDGRFGSVIDVIIDVSGVLLLLVIVLFFKLKGKK